MGTNYYVPTEKCPACGRSDDDIHLGKSSAGWKFCLQFNGGKYYKNISEMREWLKDKKIKDEYGKEVAVDDFWELVESKQEEMYSHLDWVKNHGCSSVKDIIIDGYEFYDGDFS